MKGVIFNALASAVATDYGSQPWREAVAESGVDGRYHDIGNYDHSELLVLINALARKLDTDAEELVYWFGTRAVRQLHSAWPRLFAGYHSSLALLMDLNNLAHHHIAPHFPGAEAPRFDYPHVGERELQLSYDSPQRLCHFTEGLIAGTGALYAERLDVYQTQCVLQGNERCVFRVQLC